jgi:single-strand DNA-binding protein
MSETRPNSQSSLRLGYLNNVILLGRLTADPDLRYTPKGTPVCTFRIAVNRRFKDQTANDWKDETYFFTVNTWAQLAERIGERLKKGSAVLVQGELRSRSWETPTGEKRTAIEIYGRSVQVLDKALMVETPATEPEPDLPAEDEPDIPKDQLDDIPF